MSEKTTVKDPILEACRKKGPMDSSIVRGTKESSADTYQADAMKDAKFLQFSYDGNTPDHGHKETKDHGE